MALFIRNITLLKLGFDKSYSVVFIFTLYWWFDFRFCYSWLIQCLACSGDAVLTAVTFPLHIPVIDKIISYAILCKRHLHIHTTNTWGMFSSVMLKSVMFWLLHKGTKLCFYLWSALCYRIPPMLFFGHWLRQQEIWCVWQLAQSLSEGEVLVISHSA